MPPLSEVKIRSAKGTGKVYRLHDDRGLYLEVSVAGGKLWRWKYRFEGKEKRLALGSYPAISLREAREARDHYRLILLSGVDPSVEKKRASTSRSSSTFHKIALEFLENKKNIWSSNHYDTVVGRLNLDVFPRIGELEVDKITPIDVLNIIRKIEERRAFETASRVLNICSQVLKYAVACALIPSDPCRDLKGALVPHKKGKLAALTNPVEVGALMRAIDDYKGSAIVRSALLFSALTFCRPGEIRHAEWCEIDFCSAMWTIPAEKMKIREEHKVPLSKQAVHVLNEIKPLTGNGRFIFHGQRSKERPLSEVGVISALRIMGYSKEQMTAHGFRSTASTLLNEMGYKFDVIEAQLAHRGHDRIRAIYNRAEYMDERRQLMQAWADYLDRLKDTNSTFGY